MKKFIALVALVLVSASTMMYAQESNAAARRAERKAQRDAERAKLRAEEEVQDMAAYQQAVQALKNKQFVLEANQVVFRNGMSAFVTSNTDVYKRQVPLPCKPFVSPGTNLELSERKSLK